MKKIGKCISFLVLLIFYSSHLNAHECDQALYAISSLRCHLQQLNEVESQELNIPFEPEEIDQLWKTAAHPAYASLLQQAKYYYDQSNFEETQYHLDYVWEHLLKYPNFDKNPFLTFDMKSRMAPYLLPISHPMKPILDGLFSFFRVTANLDTLEQAGFDILHVKDSSFIVVAKHPTAPEYIFKLYVDSDIRTRLNKPSWKWLLNRCIGAERIKKLIERKKIKHFTVADKWLYPLPANSPSGMLHPVILMATDMKLVSRDETKEAWRTKVTPEHLDELYCILSHGCGSNFLSSNVPYSKSGKFAFIDTEYPERKITLWKVKFYIAPELHLYWDYLVITGGKK